MNSFADVIGITRLKSQIYRSLVSCQKRGTEFPHSLLTGLGGTGKSKVARCIAGELNRPFCETEAAELGSRQAIADLLLRESSRCTAPYWVLFIDEIHRLSVDRQEDLYYPMKERRVNTSDGSVRLKPFTLIGATTRIDVLDQGSFVTRFQNVWDFCRYPLIDIETIVGKAFGGMGIVCEAAERYAIAKRALGIPRVAISLAEKVRDQVYYAHHELLRVLAEDVRKVFVLEELDTIGLSKAHITYLRALLSAKGSPKGLSVLSATVGRNKNVVEDTIEPILISLGFVSATPKGRVLTELGFRHLAYQNLA